MTETQAKEKRTKEIKLRLTPAEHRRLSALAGGRPLAEWIREFALSAAQSDIFEQLERQHERRLKKRQARKETLTIAPELLRQLTGIGNNVNQLAKLANSGAAKGTPLELAIVAVELNAINASLAEIKAQHSHAG